MPSRDEAGEPEEDEPVDGGRRDTHLYVLKLENDKMYVGTTEKEVHQRLAEHRNGDGTEWTRANRPVAGSDAVYWSTCISRFSTSNPRAEEDFMTEKLMHEYGPDKVRGGVYCQMNLEEHFRKTLQVKFNAWNGVCFICGARDHWSEGCPSRLAIDFTRQATVSSDGSLRRSFRRWSEEEKEQLARMKREGKTNEEIAGILERSENAIYVQWNKQKPRDS